MSSDEELYVVEEILNQRKRKGILEYLVRWQGYSSLYNSWEPASGVAHCTELIKEFLAKKKSSRSRSRSRSRGRSATKSKSRSRSRGRQPKSSSTPNQINHSPAPSAAQTVVPSSKAASISLEKDSPSASLELSYRRSKLRDQGPDQRLLTAKTEMVPDFAKGARQRAVVESTVTRTVDTDQWTLIPPRTVKTDQWTPPKMQSAGTVPLPSLAVRQVQNDQKPASTGASTGGHDNQTWIWWFVDYATLAIFILVSLCVLAVSLESFSSMVPNAGVLYQRLGESYELLARALGDLFHKIATTVSDVYENLGTYTDGLRNVIPGGGEGEENQQSSGQGL
ncbi:uncharacterized protein LOC143300743 [Babylonia areolata]|uniref:uncharacterized protein LOC143300743 n=1 Tax=Babylonia areolata TaxID=304850 RepID=UPI003FD007DF